MTDGEYLTTGERGVEVKSPQERARAVSAMADLAEQLHLSGEHTTAMESRPKAQMSRAALRRALNAVMIAPDQLDTEADTSALAWQSDSLCAQTDPEAFFPEKGSSTKNAKSICNLCDVRGDCLEYALQNDERYGVWGGLSERERRKLKKSQRSRTS